MNSAPKLKTGHAVLMALSFMAPAMALLATFSLVMVAGYTWAGVPLAYLGAGICIIITATSFAALSRKDTGDGSIWAYSKNILGYRAGQFPVWLYLLEILVVPTACLVPVAFFVQAWLGIPNWLTVLIAAAIVLVLANMGMNLSFKAMAVLFFAQIAILLFFAVSAIVWSVQGGTFAEMATVSLKPTGSLMGITGILVGAAGAVFSYLGFEAPASMAGELENPERSVPRAIMISAILGTLINVFMAWAFVLAIPTKGLFSLLYFVNPVPAMAGVIWQNLPPFYGGWQHLINLAGIVSGLVGALAAVTSGSRILEQLSNDEVLPKPLGRRNGKGLPVLAIGLIIAITLVLGEFLPWETVAYLIATGAIPTFLLVNFMAFWQNRDIKPTVGGVLRYWVLPWIGVIACGYILVVGLPATMKAVLLIWAFVGLLVIAVRALNGKEKKGSVGAVVISAVLVVVSIAGVAIWHLYKAGGMKWWHIKAPYAVASPVGGVIAVVLAVAVLAVSAMALKAKKGGDPE